MSNKNKQVNDSMSDDPQDLNQEVDDSVETGIQDNIDKGDEIIKEKQTEDDSENEVSSTQEIPDTIINENSDTLEPLPKGNKVGIGGEKNITVTDNKAPTIINQIHNHLKGKDEEENTESSISKNAFFPILHQQSVPNYKSDKLTSVFEELNEKRILIVNCLSDRVLSSIQNSIVQYFGGYNNSYQIWGVSFNKVTEKDIQLTIDTFENTKIGEGHPAIIFAESPPNDFIYSMRRNRNKLHHLKTIFKQKEMFLVCLISTPHEEVLTRTSYLCDPDYFEYWHLPFLKPLLRQFFEDDESQTFAKKINTSGFKIDLKENELHDRIKTELTLRRQNFPQFVEKLDTITEETNKVVETLIQVFNSNDLIKRIVLFIGAYFSKISYRDFDEMVVMLLNNKQEIIYEKTTKKRTVAKEVPLTNRWKEQASEILEECKLNFIRDDNENYTIEFDQADYQRKLKDYLEATKYPFLQGQFDIINRESRLFNFNQSNRLTTNIVRLTVEVTKFEKDIFNQNWLIGLVIQLKNYLERTENFTPQGDLYEQFIQALEHLQQINENKKVINQFINRLSTLIQEMYIQDADRFQTIVEQFIKTLIDKNIAPGFVLELTYRLQHNPNFDAPKWLKHIIHQAKEEEVKRRTYESLFKIFELEDLKELINPWLLELGEEPKNHLNRFALIFQVDYCIISIIKHKVKNFGNYPCKYELFNLLKYKENQYTLQLRKLLERLFDEPTLETIRKINNLWVYSMELFYLSEDTSDSRKFKDYNKSDQATPLGVIVDIIEAWYLLICGLNSPTETLDKSKSLAHDYLKIVNEIATPIQYSKIVKHLYKKSKSIYGFAISVNKKKPKKGLNLKQKGRLENRIEEMKLRRNIVRHLAFSMENLN